MSFGRGIRMACKSGIQVSISEGGTSNELVRSYVLDSFSLCNSRFSLVVSCVFVCSYPSLFLPPLSLSLVQMLLLMVMLMVY